MVQGTSRYRLGKLISLNPKIGHFWAILDQKYSRHVGDCAKHTEPIPTTRGRWKAYSIAHPTTPDLSKTVEATSRYGPGKIRWGGPGMGWHPPPLKKALRGKERVQGKGKLGGNVIGWVLRDSGLADAATNGR